MKVLLSLFFFLIIHSLVFTQTSVKSSDTNTNSKVKKTQFNMSKKFNTSDIDYGKLLREANAPGAPVELYPDPSKQSTIEVPDFKVSDYSKYMDNVDPLGNGIPGLKEEKAKKELKSTKETTLNVVFLIVLPMILVVVFYSYRKSEDSKKNIYGMKDDLFPNENTDIA